MPFEDAEQLRPVRLDVRPSAVLELTWVLHLLEHGHLDAIDALRDHGERFRRELTDIYEDGYECLPDVSILAERIGALLTEDADEFLRGIERAARLDGVSLDLLSEAPDVREATLRHLARLREDPALARRCAALFSDIWELLRPEWERTGLDAVRRACADWSARISAGAGPMDLLPSKHVARRAEQGRLLGMRRRVVLTPMYFCREGGSIIDVGTFVHVGGPARPPDTDAARRKEAEHLATRLKVLADGTRVALLRDLAAEPASVMDLSRRFKLAQPTVSNHIRLLRDAGLLEARKDGARVLYRVPRDQLDRLLDDARSVLLQG